MSESEFVDKVYIWDLLRLAGAVKEDEVWILNQDEIGVYRELSGGELQFCIGKVDGWLRTFLIDNDWRPGDRWLGAKDTKMSFHTKEKKERHEYFLNNAEGR